MFTKIKKMKILSINYSIIKNGFIKKFSYVSIHRSNLSLLFLDVLVREGVIRGYRPLISNKIQVFLKYHKGRSVITNIKAISSSSRSIYFSLEDILYWKNLRSSGYSFLIINSSKQVYSSNELYKHKIGGQVLCIIN